MNLTSAPPAVPADLPLRLARRRPRIVVIGDAVLDGWLTGRSDRLCREGPVPVVDVAERHFTPGAAANIAVNLAALGADAVLVGQVGDDRDGEVLRRALAEAGVDLAGLVIARGGTTTTKVRVAAADQLLVRFDEHAPQAAGGVPVDEVLQRLDALLPGSDAVVVGDYGLGLLAEPVRARLAELRAGIPLLVVDAHDCARWAALQPDLLTPSAEEAAQLLGDPFPRTGPERLHAVTEAADRLLARSGARRLAVTLDCDGAVLIESAPPQPSQPLQPSQPPQLGRSGPEAGGPVLYRSRARAAAAESHASGAGDAFTAAVTLARCGGLSWPAAVELAQAAADVVVAESGPTVCDTETLTAYLGARGSEVIALPGLEAAVRAHRAAGRRIVFTNGCFDVLHRAHVACLEEASRLGDVLVVAVNSDASVRRLKGPGRPVNRAADRAAVLSALSCVDHVTVFDADTPIDLIRRLRPEVYVKGGDYAPEMLAETPEVEAYGGEVRMVQYVPGHSTTAVIERIVAGAGAATDRAVPAERPR